MRRDERVFLLGEDIADAGGVFKVTEGLLAEFGPKRVIDTPISETAIIGAALGASLTGLIPVAELMFSDFAAVAMDQIVNQVAKKSYLSSGREKPSLVIRMSTGAGINFGPQHSQSLETWFAHTPGLYTISASNPRDAKGLLKSAIRCGRPVIFLEHKALYQSGGLVPDEEELIPIGKCNLVSEGQDVTIVSAGAAVATCFEACEKLKEEGISADLIDVRTLYPLDIKTIEDSVKKTGRIVIVEEDVGPYGWGAEIAARLADSMIYSIQAPVKRVAAPFTPVPFSPALEKEYLPSSDTVYSTIKSIF